MSEIQKDTAPEYISYWSDRSKLSENPADGEFLASQHRDFIELTVTAVRAGKPGHYDNPNIDDGLLENVRAWVHLLGPDSSLEGAHDDLLLATQRLIGNLNITKDAQERQQVFLEAGTTLIRAGRQESNFEARELTRKKAYELLSGVFENDSSYRWNHDDTGYLVDAEMIKSDLRVENVVDQFNSDGFEDYDEFEERYVVTHIESLERLKALAEFEHDPEAGGSPSGKLYEWFYVQANRHLLLMDSDPDSPQIADYHMRAALANEDSPWIKNGRPDAKNEGFDMATEIIENGKFKLLVKDQLKEYAADKGNYAPDINIHSFDIAEVGKEQFSKLISHAADVMIHQAKAKLDERIKIRQEDLEELEKIFELTDVGMHH